MNNNGLGDREQTVARKGRGSERRSENADAAQALKHGLTDQQISFVDSDSNRFAARAGMVAAGVGAIKAIKTTVEDGAATLAADMKSSAATEPNIQAPALADPTVVATGFGGVNRMKLK